VSMRTLIPRDIVLYVFLGGYVANSYCKLGEGAVTRPRPPSCGGLQGQQPCARFMLIQFPLRLPSSLALFTSYPLLIPRGPQRQCARLNVFVYWGGHLKRSKVSPRGVLNLSAARFLQTKRFDPFPFPPGCFYP
jgi:hypothetical protein